MELPQLLAGSSGKEILSNENFRALSQAVLFGYRYGGTSGLTLGIYGGITMVDGVPTAQGNLAVQLYASTGNVIDTGVQIVVGQASNTPVAVTNMTQNSSGSVMTAVGHNLVVGSYLYANGGTSNVIAQGMIHRVKSVTDANVAVLDTPSPYESSTGGNFFLMSERGTVVVAGLMRNGQVPPSFGAVVARVTCDAGGITSFEDLRVPWKKLFSAHNSLALSGTDMNFTAGVPEADVIELTGALSSNDVNVWLPAQARVWTFRVSTTGTYNVVFKRGTATGIKVAHGETVQLVTDGQDGLWLAAPRIMRQNQQSANYTTTIVDGGRFIYHPSSDNNPRTFTIASNANVPYPVGTEIEFVNEVNTVTIAITSDTLTLTSNGGTGSRSLAANGRARALKVASTKWIINGEQLT